MLKKHLDEVNAILDKLIALTEEDLENIKIAKHETVASNVEKKNELIAEFVSAKKRLDLSLLELSSSAKELSEMLDEEDKKKLDTLKKNLQILHSKNKEYARLVLIVKDFFDSLIDKMFNTHNAGTNNAYGNKKDVLESIFKINV